jgi:hypothetical protein
LLQGDVFLREHRDAMSIGTLRHCPAGSAQTAMKNRFMLQGMYRVFRFEVSISAPQLYLGSRSQQILTFARARSIWDFSRWAQKQGPCQSIVMAH